MRKVFSVQPIHDDECLDDEECRICLNQGVFRRCCNNYYCRECCVCVGDLCPGCKTTIMQDTQRVVKHSKIPALYISLSWIISLFAILLLVGCAVLLAQLFLKAPHTLWGGQCVGWFQQCKIEVCVDMGNQLEMPNMYHSCDPIGSVNKFVGKICVFDSELYKRSSASIGYDFCLLDNDSFGSVNIFEDTFDLWKDSLYLNSTTTGTLSSNWARIENGRVSDICGSNKESKYNISFDSRALTFSGVNFRYAETLNLDVSYGGRVDFYLKMAPLLSSDSESSCKSAFDGDIHLSYSVDDGLSWMVFAQFPVVKYRNTTFTNIVTPLPTESWTNHTRFKWQQSHFDPVRDFWALDDVRIFHRFPPNWRTKNLFQQKATARSEELQRIQCCLDTDQCRSFPNLYSYRSGNHCEQDYLATSDLSYRLKQVDLVIIIASVLSVIRVVYGKVIHTLERLTEMKAEPMENFLLPRSTFAMEGQASWKTFAFVAISFPFLACTIVLITIFIHASAKAQIPSHATWLSVAAVALDFLTVKWLLRNIFHSWPFHLCPNIYVDSLPDSKIHYIGSKRLFNTKDVQGSVQISRRGYWIIFLLVMFSATPIASISVLLRPLVKSNEMYHLSLYLIGTCTSIRAILGPTWILKISFSLRWLLSWKSKYRKTMALSLQRAAKFPLMGYSVLVAMIILAMITRLSDTSLRPGYLMLIVGAVTVVGLFIGLTVGLLQGLPICPEIHLTTWPKAGCTIYYQRDFRLPCILTCTHCNRLHTCSNFYLVQMNGDEYISSLQSMR